MVVVMPRRGGAPRGAAAPGGLPEAVRAAGGITLGVKGEFVLLDPSTGATVLAAPDLVRMLDGEPGVQQDLMRFQVETATRVCIDLDGLGRGLQHEPLDALAAQVVHQRGHLFAGGLHPPDLLPPAIRPRPRHPGDTIPNPLATSIAATYSTTCVRSSATSAPSPPCSGTPAPSALPFSAAIAASLSSSASRNEAARGTARGKPNLIGVLEGDSTQPA